MRSCWKNWVSWFIIGCMLQGITRFGQRVLSWALPPTCASCGVLLRYDEPVGVCPDCWPVLPRWDVKQTPVPALPKGLDSVRAPFLYEEPVRQWVPGLKFHDQTHLAPVLAGFMAPLVETGEDVLLVPVPLHASRLRGRWRCMLWRRLIMLCRGCYLRYSSPCIEDLYLENP